MTIMSFASSPTGAGKHVSFKFLAIGVVLIGANLRAPVTSIGPVLSDIQTAFAMDNATAGALNALPLLIFAVLSLVAPAAGRIFGLERVLAAALAAIAGGTIVRSLDFHGSLWGGTILLSTGIAFGNVLLPALVKRDAPHNVAGLIAAYAAAMAAMAGLAAGLAVPISTLPSFDWRWSIGIWSVLAVVALLVWLPMITQRRDGLKVETLAYANDVSPWSSSIGWQVSLFFACHSLVFYSVVDWFAVYAQSVGITAATAGVYLLIYQVVAVVTNLACVPLIRKSKDQMKLGFLCGFVLLVATTGLYAVPSAALVWIVFAGLGAGLSMTTSLSLFGLRTKNHHSASKLSGMAQFIGYLGAAAGPMLFGLFHDLFAAWDVSLFLLIGSSVLVAIFATLAGRARYIDGSITVQIKENQ